MKYWWGSQWLLGGTLLHKFPNIGMATAIPAIPPATSLVEVISVFSSNLESQLFLYAHSFSFYSSGRDASVR